MLFGPLGSRDLPVGHVADEDVPEAVLALAGHGGPRLPVQELLGLERVEAPLQARALVPANGNERSDPADPTEHGRVVQHRLLSGVKGVKPGGDDRVDGLGQRQPTVRALPSAGGVQLTRARIEVLGAQAAVPQHAHVFLGEQRVAVHGRGQVRLDRPGEPVVGEERAEQPGGVVRRQRVERHRGRGRSAGDPSRPALQQLRPGGRDHEQRDRAGRPGGSVEQALQEVEQCVVRPMEVLDHQDQRPASGQRVQEAPPGGERLLLAAGLDGPLLTRAEEQAQMGAHPGGRTRVAPERVLGGLGDLAVDPVGGVGLEDAGLGLDDLAKRTEGDGLAVGGRTALAPGDQVAVRFHGMPQLGHQPALADARLADQGHELRVLGDARALEGVEQRAELAVSAHQRHRARGGEPSAVARLQRAPHGHRLGPPGERQQAGRPVADYPGGGALGRLRHQHGAGRRGLLEAQAGGHQVAGDPRGPDARGDQRLAGGDRDAQLRPAAERVADAQRRADRALGVVLAGLGHAEHGHGGAAEGVLHAAAEAGDLGARPLQVPLQHAGDVLGVALARLARGLVDLREQHRDELALGAAHLAVGPCGLAGGCGRLARPRGAGLVAGARRAEQLKGRVLGEDRLLEPLEPDARLDAQLVDQGVARVPVRGQRVGLPARPVQRQHQVAVQVLAQGVLTDQRLQLADQVVVAARDEVGLDPRLGGADPQLVDAGELRPDRAGRHHVGQDGPTPQRHGLVQEPCGRPGVAGLERAAALVDHAAEAVQVDLVGVDLDQVAGVAGEQRARLACRGVGLLDRAAQGGDVVLQRLPHGRRRLLAPHRVDQLVGGDHLVGVQQELGQQHAVLDAAELERPAEPARLERAEHQEVDPLGHGASPPGARRSPDRWLCISVLLTTAMAMGGTSAASVWAGWRAPRGASDSRLDGQS